MRIIDVTDRLFIIDQGPTYTCGVNTDYGVILFDTCIDTSNAKRIDKILQKNVTAIFHTHSHADHMGGDTYFVKKYNCDVYINKKELSFVADTTLEPSLLYGGAAYKDIRGKFLSANSVENVAKLEDGNDLLKNENISVYDLSGHSPGHTGFFIDGCLFAGDAVFSYHIIEKYKILYLFNPMLYFISLKKIMEIDCENIIFCHKGLVGKNKIENIIRENINHINFMYENTYKLCQGLSAEEITDKLMEQLCIKKDMVLVNLINSTVKGYLCWLENDGKINVYYDKGIKWKVA